MEETAERRIHNWLNTRKQSIGRATSERQEGLAGGLSVSTCFLLNNLDARIESFPITFASDLKQGRTTNRPEDRSGFGRDLIAGELGCRMKCAAGEQASARVRAGDGDGAGGDLGPERRSGLRQQEH